MKVQGTQQEVKPIEVNIDTVYVRTNITRIESEEFIGWEYDEVQYDKDEYLEMLQAENNNMKNSLQSTLDAVDFLLINNL